MMGALSRAPLWPVTPLGLLGGLQRGTLAWTSACGAGLGTPYLGVLLATCALEAPFYLAALRRLPLRRALLLLAACNLATHPFVYFAMPCLTRHYLLAVLAGEAFAISIEAWLLRARGGLSWPTAVACSAAANSFSWQFGILW